MPAVGAMSVQETGTTVAATSAKPASATLAAAHRARAIPGSRRLAAPDVKQTFYGTRDRSDRSDVLAQHLSRCVAARSTASLEPLTAEDRAPGRRDPLPLDAKLREAVLQRALAGTRAGVVARGGALTAGELATRFFTLNFTRSLYDQILETLEEYENQEHAAMRPRSWFIARLGAIHALCTTWMSAHAAECDPPIRDPHAIRRRDALEFLQARLASERALLQDLDAFDAATTRAMTPDLALDKRPYLRQGSDVVKVDMQAMTFTDTTLDSGGYLSQSRPVGTPLGPRIVLDIKQGKFLIDPAQVERDAYVADNGPLFPHEPCIDDIKQGRLGDCYFMAALASIAERRPGHIKQMMRDNGDGTVTVRLFSPRGSGRRRTYKSKYLRLHKSVVKNRGADVYAHGSLWVALVEKAFAALTWKDLTQPAQQTESLYKYIESGRATFAFEVLLGQPADDTSIATTKDLTTGVDLPWTADAQAVYKDVVRGLTTEASLPFFTDAFRGSRRMLDIWMAWLGDHDVGAMIRAHGDGGQVRSEDFLEMFFAEGLPEHVTRAVFHWLWTSEVVPGKRGTRRYTTQQFQAFEQISQALAAGKLVSVSSNEDIGRGAGAVGHSAGETKVKGLAAKHAYSVISCRIDERGGRWITLRNPWGQYGRAYDFDAPKGQRVREIAGGGGNFELELSDLTKRFHTIRATT